MSSYIFDVKLLACIRVNAVSEREARAMIAQAFDGVSWNGGAWADGTPILFDAYIDGKPDLIDED
jgi:hypothetical protein